MDAGGAAGTVVEVLDGPTTVATVRITGDVPGLFVLDAVARLRLSALLLGWSVRVRGADADLAALIALTGLPLEVVGQPERREQPGVQEVVQPDQPPG